MKKSMEQLFDEQEELLRQLEESKGFARRTELVRASLLGALIGFAVGYLLAWFV